MKDTPNVKEALKGHSKELMKGLQDFIDEYEVLGDVAVNARAILARWQKAAMTSDEAVKAHWQGVVDKYKGKEVLTPSEKDQYEFALKKVEAYTK